MRGFPLSAKSLSIIMSLYLIFLTVNLYTRFHKGADSFLVCFHFFFFQKKRQEKARDKRLINLVLVIQKCWRRHQKRLESRRRANAAVKIQSGKLIKLLRFNPAILRVLARYCRHSVFLPKQESSEFVLKTIPLFSTNDHLLGSSVVISLKIVRFIENNAILSNDTEDDLWSA